MTQSLAISSQERQSLRFFSAALLGAALVGLSPILVRLVNMEPAAIGFYRFAFSLPILWLWMTAEKRSVDLQARDYMMMGLGGAVFALEILLGNFSLRYTTVANAAVFNNCAIFFVPLLLWLVFAKKPKRLFLLASLMAFVGSVMLAANGKEVHFAKGDILALLAAFSFAVYILVIKDVCTRTSTVTIMWWTGVSTTFFLWLAAWVSGAGFVPDTSGEWAALGALAVAVHIGGQGLYTYSMGRLSAGFIAIATLTAPITASALAWILFGETMALQNILGIAVILTSICLAKNLED